MENSDCLWICPEFSTTSFALGEIPQELRCLLSMSNNYTQFSFDFIVPESQRGWVCEVVELIDEHTGDELEDASPLLVAIPDWNEYQEPGFDISIDMENGCCWIYAEETGNVDNVIAFLMALLIRLADESQREFGFIKRDSAHLKEVGFTYADTCSSMRVNEFGGGAVRVYLNGGGVSFQTMSAHQWLADAMAAD